MCQRGVGGGGDGSDADDAPAGWSAMTRSLTSRTLAVCAMTKRKLSPLTSSKRRAHSSAPASVGASGAASMAVRGGAHAGWVRGGWGSLGGRGCGRAGVRAGGRVGARQYVWRSNRCETDAGTGLAGELGSLQQCDTWHVVARVGNGRLRFPEAQITEQ